MTALDASLLCLTLLHFPCSRLRASQTTSQEAEQTVNTLGPEAPSVLRQKTARPARNDPVVLRFCQTVTLGKIEVSRKRGRPHVRWTDSIKKKLIGLRAGLLRTGHCACHSFIGSLGVKAPRWQVTHPHLLPPCHPSSGAWVVGPGQKQYLGDMMPLAGHFPPEQVPFSCTRL